MTTPAAPASTFQLLGLGNGGRGGTGLAVLSYVLSHFPAGEKYPWLGFDTDCPDVT